MSFFNAFINAMTLGAYELTEAHSDTQETTLTKVVWEEDVEKTDELITERLVWSGGAEREITYSRNMSMGYPHAYFDRDGEEVLHINERPSYTEELDREEVTYTETETKTAYVTDLPPGVEESESTKTVYE